MNKCFSLNKVRPRPHICPPMWCSWSSWVFSSPKAWQLSHRQTLPSSNLQREFIHLQVRKLTNESNTQTQLPPQLQMTYASWNNKYWPFSENEMLVMGPWWPEKLATFVRSFKSHIFTIESSVPVPKIRPSGWNWAHVKPKTIQNKLMYCTSYTRIKKWH